MAPVTLMCHMNVTGSDEECRLDVDGMQRNRYSVWIAVRQQRLAVSSQP